MPFKFHGFGVVIQVAVLNLDIGHINTLNCKMVSVDSPQNMIFHPSFVFFCYDGEQNMTGNSIFILLFVIGICCFSHLFVMSGYVLTGTTDTARKSFLRKEWLGCIG
jgi:hypothetical protein